MLTPAPGEGYRPLKDEAELMKDSFVGLINSLNAAAQHQTVEQVLRLIVQIAEGIEEAEKRDPVFSHNHAEELIEYFEFNFREGIPKFVDYYGKLLDKHEHFIAQQPREQPTPTVPVKEKAKQDPTIDELRATIDEIESLISVKEEALRHHFGPLLKRAKELMRKRLKNEMESYEDLVKRHGKVPNDELRKRRLDRAASTHRKLILAATALASVEPEFREFTFNPIMRSVNAIQTSARDAVMKKMEVQKPQSKGRKLPVIAVLALVSLLATTGTAYWNGVRWQDVMQWLKNSGILANDGNATNTPVPPTAPVILQKNADENRRNALQALRDRTENELNPHRLTLARCQQAIGEWTAQPPSLDRETNLREWSEHRDLIVLQEGIRELISRIERNELVQAQEVDQLVNPGQMTAEQLHRMTDNQRSGTSSQPLESTAELRRLARLRALMEIGEGIKALLVHNR